MASDLYRLQLGGSAQPGIGSPPFSGSIVVPATDGTRNKHGKGEDTVDFLRVESVFHQWLLGFGPVRVVQKGGAAYNHPGKKEISRA